jgi:subtilisin-like proprotein convertase family protein
MNIEQLAGSRLLVFFIACIMVSSSSFTISNSPRSDLKGHAGTHSDPFTQFKPDDPRDPDTRSGMPEQPVESRTEEFLGTSPVSPPLSINSEIVSYGPTILAITVSSLVDAEVTLDFNTHEKFYLKDESEFHIAACESRTIQVILPEPKDSPIEVIGHWKVDLDPELFTTSHMISFEDGIYSPLDETYPKKDRVPSMFQRSTRAVYTVKGAFHYEDRELDESGFTGNTSFVPIRYADVELVDIDTQEVLGGTFTNETGFFQMSISDSTVRNLTVMAKTSSFYHPSLFNQSVMSLPVASAEVYKLESPVYPNHNPGTDIDFTTDPVNATKDDVGGPFHIFDMAEYAEKYVENLTSELPLYNLTVHWAQGENAGKYYGLSGDVYLMGTSSDDDSYDDGVILHEVGHYIALTYSTDAGVYGDHSLSGVYDIRLTYTEGLGSYFAGAVRNFINASRPMLYVETNGVSLNWYGFAMPYDSDTPSDYTSGELDSWTAANEVTVGHALFDIVDGINSNDGTPGVDDDALDLPNLEGDKLVWDVLISIMENESVLTKEISMETFYDTWMAINPYTSEFTQILLNHGIEYAEDPFEQDDDHLSAVSKNSDSTLYHHTFFGEDDPDWSTFTGTTGDEYVIKTLDLLDGADTVLEVYDSDGSTLLMQNNDMDGATKASLLRFAPDITDQYFIKCYRFEESPKPIGKYGKYNLTIYKIKNPRIDSVTPGFGDVGGGTDVTSYGSNFSAGAEVLFGVYEATNVVVVNSTTITAITPANIPGIVDVTVSNPPNADGLIPKGNLTDGFTYTGTPLPPVVNSITPDFGSTVLTTNVTIDGDYIVPGAELFFNSFLCADYTILDPKTVSATVQPLPQDLYDVNITNPDGQSNILENGFESTIQAFNQTEVIFNSWETVISTAEITEDFIISDLYVYLNLSNPNDSTHQFTITLESPNGTVVKVYDRIQVAVDGEWRTHIESYFGFDEPPSEVLWLFKGENAKGNWTLNVTVRYGEPNTLHSWGIIFFRFWHRDLNRMVYIQPEYRNYVLAVDEVTGEHIFRGRLEGYIGWPMSLAVTSDQGYVYVSTWKEYNDTLGDWVDSHLSIFEAGTGRRVKDIQLYGLMDIGALEPAIDSDKIVALTYTTNTRELYIFNTTTHMIEGNVTIPDPGSPHLGVTPDGRRAYLPDDDGEHIDVVDLTTFTLAGQVDTPGYNPIDVDISSDGTFGVTIGSPSEQVLKFDTTSDTVVDQIDGPSWGTVIELTPDNTKVFFSIYQWYAGLGVLDLTTEAGEVLQVSPEMTTFDLAISHDNKVYTPDWDAAHNDLVIWDAKDNSLIKKIDLGDASNPAGVDYADPVGKIIDLTASSGEGYVQLGWSVPESRGSPVLYYIIYRGNSSFHEELYATTMTPGFLDLNVTGGETYYYRVSAVNMIGEGGLSNEVLATPESESVFLGYGWNLISIPKIQGDTDLETVLLDIAGYYGGVQWYNVSDVSDHWKHNLKTKPTELNDLKTIDHTMSFWIFITEPDGVLFHYSGVRPITNQTISLHVGWNLVGYPSFAFHNRTSGLNNIQFGSDVDVLKWFDATTGSWQFMGPDDVFIPGRGYWVHSKVEMTWEVPL